MQQLIRTAFVTGGAQGLGRGFSKALLDRGIKVCFADVQASVGKSTETEFKSLYGDDKVMFCHCDVTSVNNLEDSFNAAVKKFGHVDLMVNNAGIGDESKLVQMISINLTAAIQGSQIALEHMRKDKGGRGGRIINVASTAGLIGVYFSPRYCASKFGLVGYHHSMASNPHAKEMGLQFGCLCPAFTDTAIINFDETKMDYYDEGLKFLEAIGINTVDAVVDGFMHFVDNDDINGDIVTVTAQRGFQVKNKHKRKAHL
ncbi:15-hydroxyprostaglandin dehydrogenase [NAD(+)] [Aplysia californica]|uniref:15-hydroxyprostaglandin dehydrogenase [NAD(+)] n=1 Tax=Aplysia californica TaxID=6500 RepID=A0ABM0JK58_APLCA|nr:15-hydroxyprostaglandin dehydrogenase [NAD(+)] [Aplysia californica]XP_005095622.1 15-hydroxyprostaglandin dehydrogenase [NAD(+)] [Aplysia californica]